MDGAATSKRPCTCNQPGCRLCILAATDARYQKLWGLPIAPGPAPGACVWQGDPTGQLVACASCAGAVQLKLHYCRYHGGACLPAKRVPGIRSCLDCPDRTTRQPAPYGGPVVRSLIYHVYPRKGNGVWQRCVSLLLRRIDQFDGLRLVGIATGPECDPPGHVQDAFCGAVRDFLVVQNDRLKLECTTFAPALEILHAVAGDDPRQITFVGHAKGVTHPVNPGTPVHEWARVAHEVCLDHPDLVAQLLERHPCAGPFKKTGKAFHDSSCGWHYSGSFYWLRNRDLFATDWRRIDPIRAGLETYPGIHWRADEAACMFHEAPARQMNLYSLDYWREVARRYAVWRVERKAVAR